VLGQPLIVFVTIAVTGKTGFDQLLQDIDNWYTPHYRHTYTMSQKNRTLVTLWHNFINTALMLVWSEADREPAALALAGSTQPAY